MTEPIDISDLKADKSFDVKLVSPEGVSLSPERVRVTLIIGRASGS
jgi:YbbR domain-containing protein